MPITEALLQKNDPELIQLAFDLLNEKHPCLQIESSEYHIKVWRGKNGVIVDFTRLVRYIPLRLAKANLEYDLIVNLERKSISPFDKKFSEAQFYIPTEQDLEALEFIKNHFGGFSAEFKNIINETSNEFKISCTNEVAFGYYTLDKTTGVQGPCIQGSYDPMIYPFEKKDDSFL